MRYIIFYFILYSLIIIKPVSGQIDKAFWFVAPDISAQHTDKPIFLRFSTFDKAANITIQLPASVGTIASFTIPANSNYTFDLTSFISEIELLKYDTIQYNGLYIQSDQPITAYYEVFGSSQWGAGSNSDIFSLKGNKALGFDFIIPMQKDYDNYAPVDAWASIDIVSTEDNNSITITPAEDVLNHPKGVPFTIILQKGETFSIRSKSYSATDRPSGTSISSTKPIAITLKDDSVVEDGAYDMLGDQMIPIAVAGNEYIVNKISYTTDDKVYILSASDNNNIYIDGSSTPIININKGEQYTYSLSALSSYIKSDEKIIVWHVSGFGRELGAAILPSLKCTGSRLVTFNRSNAEEFHLSIIVPKSGINAFKLNNNENIITGNLFKEVPGTNDYWYYLNINLDNNTILPNIGNIISNDQAEFHLATLNGTNSTGFRYGYFSDFGFLELGPDLAFCEGKTIELDAGPGLSSYLWNKEFPTRYITVRDTGKFVVEVTKGSCSFKDSLHISYHPKVTPDFAPNDTMTCIDVPIFLSIPDDYSSILWKDSTTDLSYRPTYTGYHSIKVSNAYGCEGIDSTYVTLLSKPNPSIVYTNDSEKSFCTTMNIQLQTEEYYNSYQWNLSDENDKPYYYGVKSNLGLYQLSVIDTNGCSGYAELFVDCSIYIGEIYNFITPNNDGLNDYFTVTELPENSWELAVYNEWGDRIYNQRNYDNTWMPTNLNDGTYYYELIHQWNKTTYKGWVMITH